MWNSSLLCLNAEELLRGRGYEEHQPATWWVCRRREPLNSDLSQSSVSEASETPRGGHQHTRAWISVCAPLGTREPALGLLLGL